MSHTDTPRKHLFYHADRSASLKECQEIQLDTRNLSFFGKAYWDIFQKTPIQDMSHAQQREFYLEEIRKEERYSLYASRLQSIFASNSVTEAIIFAQSIIPIPGRPVPIIEIFADRFWNLDTNWLDYKGNFNQLDYYRNYWNQMISNHNPQSGERRPPRLEVMIALPARTGKIVHVVE